MIFINYLYDIAIYDLKFNSFHYKNHKNFDLIYLF